MSTRGSSDSQVFEICGALSEWNGASREVYGRMQARRFAGSAPLVDPATSDKAVRKLQLEERRTRAGLSPASGDKVWVDIHHQLRASRAIASSRVGLADHV